MINSETLLEADLRFIHKNLCYANTQCREVFREYGEVSIEAGTYAGQAHLYIKIEGRVVYSHEDNHLRDMDHGQFSANRTGVVKWHYDSPKIRQVVSIAARKCSLAIHQSIQAQKAKEEAYRKRSQEQRCCFEEKWGV